MTWTEEMIRELVFLAIKLTPHPLDEKAVLGIATRAVELAAESSGTLTAENVDDWLRAVGSRCSKGIADDLRQHIATLGARYAILKRSLTTERVEADRKQAALGKAMEAITAAEAERDAAWSERAKAIAEKHSALADNAKLIERMQNTVASLRKAVDDEKAKKRPSQARIMEWMHALVLFEQHINMADGSPGGMLLEQHRKALARARNEGLEKAALDFDREADANPGVLWARTCRSLAARIRAMKEQEEP